MSLCLMLYYWELSCWLPLCWVSLCRMSSRFWMSSKSNLSKDTTVHKNCNFFKVSSISINIFLQNSSLKMKLKMSFILYPARPKPIKLLRKQRPVFWTKGSCLARALGVTKFISTRYMILVKLCCATLVRLRCSTNPPQVGSIVYEVGFSK